MVELAALLLGALIVNNFVLAQFLGLCPFFGITQRVDSALATGLATTFVLCLSVSLSHILFHRLLVPLELEFLNIVAFIVIVVGVVQLTETSVKTTRPALHQRLGIFMPLITTNCAVLGVALLMTADQLPLMETFVLTIAAAGGLTLVMVLFSALRERVLASDVPAAMAGTPMTLISTGILTLAFLGFQGLI